MKAIVAAAQTLWMASAWPAARRFGRALRSPEETQRSWLLNALKRDAETAYGREHHFHDIADYASFARNVALISYDVIEPWIQRIHRGERLVLTSAKVTHLAPTSGTSGARKLIPFTNELQRNFSAAVSAWLCDLVRSRPRLLLGPSYWAVSPLSDTAAQEQDGSSVRIGFADDAEYLGRFSAWLVRQALAVPSSLRHVQEIETWRRATLLCLLRQPDLRLISIWHPSYLDLLTSAAREDWSNLLAAIGSGADPWLGRLITRPNPTRARELARLGPNTPEKWWPHLQVISCWGEQAAEPGWRRLRRQFPHATVQPKGLLATEAAVTLPWRGQTPLAVTSHFFEFIAENGEILRAHELRRGASYEVVVSNGGGLWRYRLGDRVECTGHCAATPALRFLGRAGLVSDLRGEKLSETFVAQALAELWPAEARPEIAQLRPRTAYSVDGYTAWYELQVSEETDPELAGQLELALGRNPHYALARRLGQLGPAQVTSVDRALHTELRRSGGNLGDVKPRVLTLPAEETL